MKILETFYHVTGCSRLYFQLYLHAYYFSFVVLANWNKWWDSRKILIREFESFVHLLLHFYMCCWFKNTRNMVDGDVVMQYMHLSLPEKNDLARKLGTSRYHIMDDLTEICRLTTHYWQYVRLDFYLLAQFHVYIYVCYSLNCVGICS